METDEMYIRLDKLKFYSYHGVASQETVVGSYFYIDLKLKVDFSQAVESDDLTYTVSYADAFEAVKCEMEIPSQLLEHVCGRIVKRLFRDFPTIEEVYISLGKENPPMGADILTAGVEMHCIR